MIYGNATGGFGMPKLIELTDENGNTLIGTVTDSAIDLDATRDDVKMGKTFASSEGILEGKNTITYRVRTGYRIIQPGENFSIPMSDYNQYDYTKLQCIIAPYNTSFADSVAADKIVIGDCVYAVGNTIKLADVIKNFTTQSIDLSITNESGNIYLIYYFTYREEV